MRVLQVMASGARGGGADHLMGLMPALQAEGVQCSAAVGPDGPLQAQLRGQGFGVTNLSLMRSRTDARAISRVVQAVRGAAPDIVHFHGTRAAFFGALAKGLWGRTPRTVYTAHGLSFRKERTPLRRLLFNTAEWTACRADQVISVSQADLRALHTKGLLAAQRGVHIANAVDTQRYAPAPAAAARTHLGLPHDAFIVGTTSRLVPQKAVHDLLDALEHAPGVLAVILGDGPERHRLRHHPAVLRGQARLLGARDDVPQCLPAFDVFALTSYWEGEPIALLEALACGLPCVCTRTAGSAEVVGDSAAALLVDLGAPLALAAALRQLQSHAPLRAHMRAQARALVAQRSYAATARQVLQVYGALLAHG